MPASGAYGGDLTEATVTELHKAMEEGALFAEGLVDRYLARIDAYDGRLNAILTLNEGARERARHLDMTFEQDGFVGPLHGIPIVLKDNQDTHDMPTTAGVATFENAQPREDAFVVQQIRAAGGIILGKANLQELSYGVDTVSSLGGATRNAYDLDRRPAGSSGGSAAAVAANLATLATGTDTCSSVRSPPAFHALVGIRPTTGLVSTTGVVPLASTQDTVGPIARTVSDAAILLEVMAGYDPSDPVTTRGDGHLPAEGYRAHLTEDSLQGARIGVARQFFGLQDEQTNDTEGARQVNAVVEDAIEEIEAAGATIVDPVEVIDLNRLKSARVLPFEFARDLNAYLAQREDTTPVSSLQELVDSGTLTDSVEARIHEAGILDHDTAAVEENVDYLRRLRRRNSLRNTVLARFIERDLDAMLYPPSTIPPVSLSAEQPFDEMNCELASHTGLPALVVPAGFTEEGLPVGLELLGRPFTEETLLGLGFAYEQAADPRQPPDAFGPLST